MAACRQTDFFKVKHPCQNTHVQPTPNSNLLVSCLTLQILGYNRKSLRKLWYNIEEWVLDLRLVIEIACCNPGVHIETLSRERHSVIRRDLLKVSGCHLSVTVCWCHCSVYKVDKWFPNGGRRQRETERGRETYHFHSCTIFFYDSFVSSVSCLSAGNFRLIV